MAGYVPLYEPPPEKFSLDWNKHVWVDLPDDRFPLWAVLAIALLLQMQSFCSALLTPAKRLGVYFHTSYKMMKNDVTIFLCLFLVFFSNYGLAMFICYPRTGEAAQPY